MDSVALKSFMAVYKTKSFSRAAEILYISQPSLSKHIKSLENEFNVVLFDRNKRSVRPTVAGDELYKYALEYFELEKKIDNAMSMTSRNCIAKLTIALTPGLELRGIVETVRQFSARHKDIKLEFTTPQDTSICDIMMKQIVDVGISSQGELNGIPDYETVRISHNKVSAALVSKEHPFAEYPFLRYSSLEGQDVLFYYDNVSPLPSEKARRDILSSCHKFKSETVVKSIVELVMYASTGKYVGISCTRYNELIGGLLDSLSIIPFVDGNFDHVDTAAAFKPDNRYAREFVELLRANG